MHFSGSFLMCAPLMLRNLLINNGQNFDMNLPRVINPSFFFGFLQRQSKGMRFILGWPSCTLSIRVPHGRDHLFTGMTSSQDVPESLFFAGYILLLVFLSSQIYICYLMLFVFGMGYTCFLKNPQGQSYDLLVHVPLEWNYYTLSLHFCLYSGQYTDGIFFSFYSGDSKFIQIPLKTSTHQYIFFWFPSS